MSDQVEEIKRKTDIVSLIGEHVDLKKAGRNYKANCPFHSEKTPSFMVSPELQMFKCFGCGESGDVFTFLEKYEGMDFFEALKYLAEKVGVKLDTSSYKTRGDRQKLLEITDLACKFYHFILLNHPSGKEALNYLTKTRGLKIDTIKEFKLGFSPEVPFAIKSFLVDKKGFSVSDLEKVGIAYSGRKVVDRFRSRVIFPLFDHRGNVRGFAGRILPKDDKKDLAKYINTPETEIYHKSNLLYGLNTTKSKIKREKEAVVVEGELDLISSWQAGVQNVVALKGSAFTQEQASLIARFTQKVTLALDADIAGDAAARRGITIAEEAGLEVSVFVLHGFKDPDEAARNDPENFKKALKNPIGVWDFIFDSIIKKQDIKSGKGKARISREAIPILSSIKDEIVRSHYVSFIARKLKVSEDAVLQEVRNFIKGKKEETPEVSIFEKKEGKNRQELLEERLVSVLLTKDPMGLTDEKIKKLLIYPFSIRTAELVKTYFNENKKFDLVEFSKTIPNELKNKFSDLILLQDELLKDESAYGSNLDEDGRYERDINEIVTELELLDLKKKLQKQLELINKYEKLGQSHKLRKAQEKFAKISGSISKQEGS